MNDHLKQFANHSAYSAAESQLMKPNVSLCVQENEVHYNPYVDTRLIVTYTVTDASEPTQLYFYGNVYGYTIEGAEMFDKIEIDDVEVSVSSIDSAEGKYQLSNGIHIVKYTLIDPTILGGDLNLLKIGGTFYGCHNVTNVNIPNSVTNINQWAFSNCSGLTSVTIPDSVTYIGIGAFGSCYSLTSVTIPDSVITIDDSAFSNCSGLTSIVIPNSVTSIGELAFGYSSGLTSVTIGNSVTTIGDSAFRGLFNLSSVTIPNSVISIGEHAFGYSSSLTSVTIGNSVTTIGDNAFRICPNLISITSLSTIAPTIQNETFYGIGSNGTLYVPQGSSGYDTWMGTGDYYLGKYGWTKVEQ